MTSLGGLSQWRSRAIACSVTWAILVASCQEAPSIPDPDTSGMEAQVAAKIASRRRHLQQEIDSAERWGELGMVFHAHELYAEAATSYSEARRLAPDEYRWPYLEAQSLKEQREAERALESVEAALAREPSYAPLFALKAALLEQLGKSEEALTAYRSALEVDADCALAHFGVGRLTLGTEEGLEHLERAATLEPEAGAIQALLARAYLQAGNREAATRAAALARTLHPEVPLDDPVMAAVLEEAVSVSGLQSRAVEAEARGEPHRAEMLLRKMIELRPEDANLPYNLANNLSRQGRFQEAEPYYRESLHMDPNHVAALINLGILLSQRSQFVEARELFERALAADPESSGALASLGKVAALQGDITAAIGYFERALRLDPANVETYRALSQALQSMGRRREAMAPLRKALEIEPARGELHFELAVLHAQEHEFDRAREEALAAESRGFPVPQDFMRALPTSRN
ncbi:MAG TPA: tetratricopeptide repeat protein [Vicinamibacteria bacterium]|nr:tetratricopeptide repeat protein [Vicinamibacteria bacterium]